MSKKLLLDLFCGAGGCAVGYNRAGFDIVGVDKEPQPNYPFKFIQADAIEFLQENWREFDAIHASPPCQRFSELTPVKYRDGHPDLLTKTLHLLRYHINKPYIVENVEGARRILHGATLLCGSMFGMNIFRHRYFESSIMILSPGTCQHTFKPVLVSGRGMRRVNGKRWNGNTVDEKREAMDIDWMTGAELTEAIPPAYTEYIGKQLMGCFE